MKSNLIFFVVLAAALNGLLPPTSTFLVAQQPAADEVPDRRLASSHWGGNYFPNVELTSSKGEKVRFFSDLIEDKVVMINFIYTRCPDACPLETAKLSEVYQILRDRMGEDVFMYSISIDPEHDTPEVLSKFMETYQIEEGWEFFTGTERDILLLRKKLGLYISEVNKDPFDHNLSMLIGNQRSGRWMKRSPFENPYILATEIGTWLHNYKQPSGRKNQYQDAPELRTLTQGESLFRTRCSACHNIGRDENSTMKLGPNLLDVTTLREHTWLRRWIKEPDVMLSEGDPIATGLFEAYNRLPMPNLRLNGHEIDSLLSFLETESRRVNKVQQVAAIARQKDVELPEDCCQKAEQTVIGLSAETTESFLEQISESSSLETTSNDAIAEKTEEDALVQAASTRPSTFQMASWLCGLGLGFMALRFREKKPADSS